MERRLRLRYRSYLSWEEDSVLTTDLDDDIDSEEEDSDLENLDEDMELATKNPQRRTTETLSEKANKTNCSMQSRETC